MEVHVVQFVIFNSQFVKISTFLLCNASFILISYYESVDLNPRSLFQCKAASVYGKFIHLLWIYCNETVYGEWDGLDQSHQTSNLPPPLHHHPLLPWLDSLLYLSIKKETHYQWFNQQLMSWFYCGSSLGCRGLTHYMQCLISSWFVYHAVSFLVLHLGGKWSFTEKNGGSCQQRSRVHSITAISLGREFLEFPISYVSFIFSDHKSHPNPSFLLADLKRLSESMKILNQCSETETVMKLKRWRNFTGSNDRVLIRAPRK